MAKRHTNKSHPELGLPEVRKLTDRLIDQIVYRLYGLTPAEIKVVEESVKK